MDDDCMGYDDEPSVEMVMTCMTCRTLACVGDSLAYHPLHYLAPRPYYLAPLSPYLLYPPNPFLNPNTSLNPFLSTTLPLYIHLDPNP